MNKKKAIKVALSTAVAASAFVAANPGSTQAASVNEATTLVKSAQTLASQLKPFYTSNVKSVADVAVSSDFSKKYSAAKVAIDKAQAAVNSLSGNDKIAWQSHLDAAKENYLQAARFIDSVKVGAELDAKVADLQEYIDAQQLDADAVAAYNEVSAAIRKAERVMSKAYGETYRNLLLEKYVTPAKIAKETVIYEVSRYVLQGEISDHVAAGELEVAADKIAMLDRLEQRAIAIKEAGNELHPGMYPSLPQVEAALAASKAVVVDKYEAAVTPAVKSVSAINAKELVITFNKAVKKDTVVDGAGNLINATVNAIATAPAVVAPKASLSEDGKTLTVTATTKFDGQYAVTVPTSVKTTADVSVTAYSSIVTASDSARPTAASVTYSDYQTAVITFSEPLVSLGTIAANNPDISFGALSADGKSVSVNLAHANVKADTDYKVTIIGAKDFNDNLITPNPVEVTVKKSSSDTVKPTVSTLSVVNDKTFTVTFSEKLIANPTIKVNGDTVVVGAPGAGQVQGTITKDTTGLVYTVTLNNSLVVAPATSALATVEASFTDLSGNASDAFSRIVEFKKDTTAPALLSSTVEKINGKEYLILNYNENVTPVAAKAITGKVVKDYVETASSVITTDTVTEAVAPITPANFELHNAVDGKTKSVRIDLASLTSGAYTLNLPTGLVTDESTVDSTATTVSFTRTSNVDTGKPALTSAGTNGITKIDNNTYTVSFDRQLDAISALALSNYSIEGATIKSAIFTKNDATGAVVRLTLNENSVSLTGDRTITIQNVKSAAGVVMDKVTTVESLTENVNPVVTSAQLVGLNKIKVVFSENIDATTVTTSVVAANDFEVLIGDVAEAGATIAEDATDLSGKTYIITLSDDVSTTEYAKTITLKAGSGLDVADESGNILTFTATAVIK